LVILSRRCELARKTPTADYGGDAMTEIRLASLQGGAITFGSDAIAAFRQTLRGNVCLAEEPGYEEARTIWNAMIDRHPGAVVRCRGAADIIRAVRFAREPDPAKTSSGQGERPQFVDRAKRSHDIGGRSLGRLPHSWPELYLHPVGLGNVHQNDFRFVRVSSYPVEWFANGC
jgi:hypothetical protein